MIYQETNRFGIELAIHYTDTLDKVIAIESLNRYFQDIYENTFKYMGNIWQGLKLDIWDDLCPDIPRGVKTCTNDVCSVSYAIGEFSGLTWGSLNKMHLNDNLFGPESSRDSFMSNLLSHEAGHLIDTKALIPNIYLDKQFENSRPRFDPAGKEIISIPECKAEDIRILFGSRLAKGMRRGSYIQAPDVKGLEGLYKIWKKSVDLLTFYSKDASILQLAFVPSPTRFDYMSLQFRLDYRNAFWKWNNRWIKIDNEGVWQNNSQNFWELTQRF